MRWLLDGVALPDARVDRTHLPPLMVELPVVAILVNFDTLLYCTRTIVDTKEYSISNEFSACSGVVMYI